MLLTQNAILGGAAGMHPAHREEMQRAIQSDAREAARLRAENAELRDRDATLTIENAELRAEKEWLRKELDRKEVLLTAAERRLMTETKFIPHPWAL